MSPFALALVVLGASTDIPTQVRYPIPVRVALRVNNVSNINELEGSFNAEVDFRQTWTDPRLAFDQRAIGSDRQEFGYDDAPKKLAGIWNPGVALANMDKGPQDDRTAMWIFSNGTVEVLRRLNARFRSKLDLGRFPFDSQPLQVEIRSTQYGAARVMLVHDREDRVFSILKPGIAIPNWHFDESVGVTQSLFRGWSGRDHAISMATITAHREPGQYFFQLFLPFLIIMLFPPLALWVPKVETLPRANLTFTGLFSLIAFSYSIFVRYPMLAAVDNLVVKVLWIGYMFLGIVLVLVMSVHNPGIAPRFGGKHVAAEVAAWSTWAVPLLLVVTLGGSVLYAT